LIAVLGLQRDYSPRESDFSSNPVALQFQPQARMSDSAQPMPKWLEMNPIYTCRQGITVLMLSPWSELPIPQAKNREFAHEQLIPSP
jgi:hypothetical protein